MNAKFVRIHPSFSREIAKIKKQLASAMEKTPAGDPAAFLAEVIGVTLRPGRKHDNETDCVFYNDLFNAVLDSLQEPNEVNILMASVLAYCEGIEFAGYTPRFSINPIVPKNMVEDAEPTFNVWVQDDQKCPQRTLALRFTVNKEGDLHFAPINVGWVNTDAPAVVEAPKAKEVAKPAAKKKPAKKVTASKR